MVEYNLTVNATSNGTINTEDTFVEISAVVVSIKRVRVRLGDGTATAGVDNDFRVRLVRKTAAGVGTTATGTGVRQNQMSRTTGATLTVKSGTNTFSTATLGDVVDTIVANGRQIVEWVARDDDDLIITHPTLASGGMFAVLVQSAVVSQKFQVSVWWAE